MAPVHQVAWGWMLALLVVAASSARATVIWDESASGDLSNAQAAPTAFNLSLGTNSIVGTVGTGDTQDFVALTVPAGDQLSSLVLAAYQSTDVQGFTGVQAGASFVGSPFSASSYLGYVHYGTAATNGALPATNLVGSDLLPLMGDNTIATGSTGFMPPLASGTYTFLIQQLGATTSYQFDYAVTAVPEPSSAGLLALGGLALAWCGRRRVFLRSANARRVTTSPALTRPLSAAPSRDRRLQVTRRATTVSAADQASKASMAWPLPSLVT